jgi:oligoendopeptidase F
MADTLSTDLDAPDHVHWDLEPLVGGDGLAGVERLLDQADAKAAALAEQRGHVAELDAAGLAELMDGLAALEEDLARADSYAGLRFATDTGDQSRGALVAKVEERATAIRTQLLFFELEWAALDDARAEALLDDPRLDAVRHHLRVARLRRPHLLTEPEERIAAEKDLTAIAAWQRLFEEQDAAIEVTLDGEHRGLEHGLSLLAHPDRSVRQTAAEAVTDGLAPGLRTRAFILNTILLEKATDDRLRHYDHWLASRNLVNQASDASVTALIDAVKSRYDLPQRWYRIKAGLLGLDRLADYDRNCSVASEDRPLGWSDATELVLDAYDSFSPDLAGICRRFLDEGWIDAPATPGKRSGAFCAYTVPSHHPYVMLNWTGRRSDALTLAHELGHGVHGYLARPQGIFQMTTPLTMAETASVFGETVTFGRLLADATDPADRLSLLSERIDGAIATVFRQVAMNQFEDRIHTARRTSGELSVERFGDLWAETQAEMFGDAMEVTEGYRTWWSYIWHCFGAPGYVYAYAFGQLLALSVYRRYEEEGAAFVPRYLEMLGAGGSLPPEELGRLVDCDLADPGFWHGGLAIIEDQIDAADAAANARGNG